MNVDLDRLEAILRSIGSKPDVRAVLTNFGLSDDPLAENNSLYEHFMFLLRCGISHDIALSRIADSEWLRYSLQIRGRGDSAMNIALALTDGGRLYQRGQSPVFGDLIPSMLRFLRLRKKPPQ